MKTIIENNKKYWDEHGQLICKELLTKLLLT